MADLGWPDNPNRQCRCQATVARFTILPFPSIPVARAGILDVLALKP
jgi:hypothetical protein